MLMTNMLMEQTKIETLFQASRELLINEMENSRIFIDHTFYELPHGDVEVYAKKINEELCQVIFTITTDSNSVKSIVYPLSLYGLLD